jgi:hypothetical protein
MVSLSQEILARHLVLSVEFMLEDSFLVKFLNSSCAVLSRFEVTIGDTQKFRLVSKGMMHRTLQGKRAIKKG